MRRTRSMDARWLAAARGVMVNLEVALFSIVYFNSAAAGDGTWHAFSLRCCFSVSARLPRYSQRLGAGPRRGGNAGENVSARWTNTSGNLSTRWTNLLAQLWQKLCTLRFSTAHQCELRPKPVSALDHAGPVRVCIGGNRADDPRFSVVELGTVTPFSALEPSIESACHFILPSRSDAIREACMQSCAFIRQSATVIIVSHSNALVP